MLDILYEDPQLIVVKKPAGVDSQSSRGFGQDMVNLIRNHLVQEMRKTGQSVSGIPYVAAVHRLDKPVSGVMVYAKTKQAAADLSRQMRLSAVHKRYYGLICGKPAENQGIYVDYLLQNKEKNRSGTVAPGTPGARLARLGYRLVEPESDEWVSVTGALGWSGYAREPEVSLVQVDLFTGRHHQIRVQMAAHGTPLYGDGRYQSLECRRGRALALCAWELEFSHPGSGKPMHFVYYS